MKNPLVKIFVIIVFAGLALHIPVFFQGCQTNAVELINRSGSKVQVTIKVNDEYGDVVFQEVIKDSIAYTAGVDLRSISEMVYYIKVENIDAGEVLEEQFGYVFPHDGEENLFLIKYDGIHHTRWSMYGNGVVGAIRHAHHFITNELSCLM